MSGAFNMAAAAAIRLAFMTALLAAGGSSCCIGFIVWCVITFMLVKRNGQTIAKKMLGIKVVRADGSPASRRPHLLAAQCRQRPAAVIPSRRSTGCIDPLWIFGEESRCLHDKIADTIVVKA